MIVPGESWGGPWRHQGGPSWSCRQLLGIRCLHKEAWAVGGGSLSHPENTAHTIDLSGLPHPSEATGSEQIQTYPWLVHLQTWWWYFRWNFIGVTEMLLILSHKQQSLQEIWGQSLWCKFALALSRGLHFSEIWEIMKIFWIAWVPPQLRSLIKSTNYSNQSN